METRSCDSVAPAAHRKRNPTSSRGPGRLLPRCLAFGLACFLVLGTAERPFANVRVNQDPPGNMQNSPSITLERFWGNIVTGYTDLPGTAMGPGASYCPIGPPGSWLDSTIQPPLPPGWLGWEQDISVASDGTGATFLCYASYDQWQLPWVWPPTNNVSAIYVAVSSDGGVTFPFTSQVSYQGMGIPCEVKPKIEVDDFPASPHFQNAYVGWERDMGGFISDVCFSNSTDGAQTWSPAAVINDNPGNCQLRWPDLAVGSDGTVHAAWLELPVATPPGTQSQGQIWVDRSADGGVTWGQDTPAVTFWTVPQLLTDQTAQFSYAAMSYPSIEVNPSNPQDVAIVYATDPDNGTCNETRLDVGDLPAGNSDAYLCDYMHSGSNMSCNRDLWNPCVYAVYTDLRNTPSTYVADLYFHGAPIVNGIAQWRGTEVNLCTQPANRHYTVNCPSIVSGGSDIHVAWDEWVMPDVPYPYFIYYNGSNDYGISWSGAVHLDTQTHPYRAFEPVISMSGSNVCVVWQARTDSTQNDLIANYSTDGGATWSPNEITVHSGGVIGGGRDIAQGGTNVHVVWAEGSTPTTSHIYISTSATGGLYWSMPIQLDNPTGASQPHSPRVCCDNSGKNVYVAWRDDRNSGHDIYFAYSHSYGSPGTWSTDIPLNANPGAAVESGPQIACDGSFVAACYWSDRHGIPGHGPWDIYVSCSEDGGVSWQEFRANVGTMPGTKSAGSPRVSVFDYGPPPAFARAYVYVTWSDDRNTPSPGTGSDIYATNLYWDYNTGTWQGPTQDYRADTGDPPGTGHSLNPHIASEPSGPFYLFQDDRNGPGTVPPFTGYDIYANQNSTGPDQGDIYCILSNDGGQTWGAPLRVNDDPAATSFADQTHPWADFKPNGVLDVVWYDKRLDQPNDQNLDVYTAAIVPGAGGPTVRPNVRVTNQTIVAPVPGPWWIGDYIWDEVDSTDAHVAWTDLRMPTDWPLGDIFYDMVPNPSVGACCLPGPPQDSCAVMMEDLCLAMGGEFMGNGTTCDPNPCGGTSVEDVETSLLEYRLHESCPNPFSLATTIRYSLAEHQPVSLRIYDVSGRLVRALVDDEVQCPGEHHILWNGTNTSGRMAAPGVYFCRLEAGRYSEIRRMVLLR